MVCLWSSESWNFFLTVTSLYRSNWVMFVKTVQKFDMGYIFLNESLSFPSFCPLSIVWYCAMHAMHQSYIPVYYRDDGIRSTYVIILTKAIGLEQQQNHYSFYKSKWQMCINFDYIYLPVSYMNLVH